MPNVYDFPAAIERLSRRAALERGRWAPHLAPALRRLRQLAEATLDAPDLLRAIDREQRHAVDTDRNWDRGAWRSEMLGTLRDVLATPEELASAEQLTQQILETLRTAR